MNAFLFLGMASGIFVGNTTSSMLVLHYSLSQALWLGGTATVFWMILFGLYLKFFSKR